MTQNVGGSIGQRLAALAFHAATRSNSIGLGIVTKVHKDMMKVDVALKNTKGSKVVELFNCPVISQSYQGGGQINIPRIGDLVVLLYSKYNIEDQIKNGSLYVNAIDEVNVSEQNYGIVIGTIFPMPETQENMPDSINPLSGENINIISTSDGTNRIYFFNQSPDGGSPNNPPYNRSPIFHAEAVDNSTRFIEDRLRPAQNHQIWYHPYDHEIRMTPKEIHIKHKSGSQIIFREPGDIEIYAWRGINVHAKGNIFIESEQMVDIISKCAPKDRPWRAEGESFREVDT